LSDYPIQLVVKGTNGKVMPLLSVAEAFKEFHHTIDKAYTSISGKDKLTKSDRKLYKVLATDIKSGSIVADLLIVLPPMMQSAFNWYSTGLSVKELWNLITNSFKLSKILAELKQQGKKPTIAPHHNPFGLDVNIINYGDNVNIIVGDIVNRNTLRSEPHIKNLAKIVDEENITQISALDSKNNGIVLTSKENKLFNPEIFIDKTPFEFQGKIFKLDVEARRGRLRIMEGEHNGEEYSFQITGRQNMGLYVDALKEPYSIIIALKEMVRHSTGVETLHGFQLIGISNGSKLF